MGMNLLNQQSYPTTEISKIPLFSIQTFCLQSVDFSLFQTKLSVFDRFYCNMTERILFHW